eukprot:CAMPEP_0183749256 /NCGR_PEP_ID=MMETSP0737-20130205/68189_1 /TAXON_ID=385413 /ORGANISM="Thalassiosira miniscula, Strain CCMP1093" /LENGTH=480 /DNA_ID=CAMNT_0025985009 /DNA_START=161 /DNA_END=1603 /DNA_ORIENTATION=-
MTSKNSTKESREVDAANARLKAATRRATSALELSVLAAQTVGYVQLAANQLGAEKGETLNQLMESASATLALAQSQVVSFDKEVMEAEKDLTKVKQEWAANGGAARRAMEGRCYSSANDSHLNVRRRKRRLMSDPDDDDDIHDAGGTNRNAVKKNKNGRDGVVMSTSGTAAKTPRTGPFQSTSNSAALRSAAAFSFGSVPPALPRETFTFNSNSANATSTGPSSTPTSSFANVSVCTSGERSASNVTTPEVNAQAPKPGLESRKIVRASRRWYKSRTREAAGGKIASVFASVKLAPSNPAEAMKEEEGTSSDDGPVPGSTAAPVFPFLATSSEKLSSQASNGTTNKESTDVCGNMNQSTGEEKVYEIRAKRFKRVDEKWKKDGSVGILQLLRHKNTSKCRMVIRNEFGQGPVQFNVHISKGMVFHKVSKESLKGICTYVKFLAIEDVNRGMETFMLQVRPEFVDKFQQTLEDIAKTGSFS